MSAPDRLALRAYQREAKRHRLNADRAASRLAKLVAEVQGDANPLTALGAARNLASELTDLTAALSALTALHDVEFLTDDLE